MDTIQQVQKGFVKFIDNHVAGAYSGIEKTVVLGGATLISAGLPNLIKQYCQNGVVGALGVVDAESGFVDIDALYNAFVPHMGAEKIPIKLPKIGAIDLGTIKFGREEMEALFRYIKEA